MKKIITLGEKVGGILFSLVIPLLAHADAAVPAAAGTGNNGAANVPTVAISKTHDILNLVCTAFGWAFYFLIALSILFGIFAAFKYLTASGDSEKVREAGSTLLYAAVAVGVALLARAIPLIVAGFLGASGNLGTC